MKKLQLGGIYFLLYFAFSALSIQAIPFMNQIGYANDSRGLLFGIMAFISIIAQFVVGYICDRFHWVKQCIAVLIALMGIGTFFSIRKVM